MSSFNGSSPNLDNLFLQNLMDRLQIRPPPSLSTAHNTHLLNQTLEDILLDAAANHPFSDDESDADSESPNKSTSNRSQLAREESRLEKEIIKVVLAGNTDSLKPNSGQAVSIGEHHICVGFHEDSGSDYRVWEWHGHIMLFDEEDGFTPEYIYGNYFERVRVRGGEPFNPQKESDKEEKIEEQVGNLGLRELIEQSDPGQTRILHRNSVPLLPGSGLKSL